MFVSSYIMKTQVPFSDVEFTANLIKHHTLRFIYGVGHYYREDGANEKLYNVKAKPNELEEIPKSSNTKNIEKYDRNIQHPFEDHIHVKSAQNAFQKAYDVENKKEWKDCRL